MTITDHAFLDRFDLTMAEVHEYHTLEEKIHGKGVLKSLFTVLDFNNPDHARLNELSGKVIKLNAYLLTHRNGTTINA